MRVLLVALLAAISYAQTGRIDIGWIELKENDTSDNVVKVTILSISFLDDPWYFLNATMFFYNQYPEDLHDRKNANITNLTSDNCTDSCLLSEYSGTLHQEWRAELFVEKECDIVTRIIIEIPISNRTNISDVKIHRVTLEVSMISLCKLVIEDNVQASGLIISNQFFNETRRQNYILIDQWIYILVYVGYRLFTIKNVDIIKAALQAANNGTQILEDNFDASFIYNQSLSQWTDRVDRGAFGYLKWFLDRDKYEGLLESCISIDIEYNNEFFTDEELHGTTTTQVPDRRNLLVQMSEDCLKLVNEAPSKATSEIFDTFSPAVILPSRLNSSSDDMNFSSQSYVLCVLASLLGILVICKLCANQREKQMGVKRKMQKHASSRSTNVETKGAPSPKLELNTSTSRLEGEQVEGENQSQDVYYPYARRASKLNQNGIGNLDQLWFKTYE